MKANVLIISAILLGSLSSQANVRDIGFQRLEEHIQSNNDLIEELNIDISGTKLVFENLNVEESIFRRTSAY